MTESKPQPQPAPAGCKEKSNFALRSADCQALNEGASAQVPTGSWETAQKSKMALCHSRGDAALDTLVSHLPDQR